MRRWLSRLSFTFIAVGCVLAWDAYTGSTRGMNGGPMTFYYIGAAICFACGLAGLTERHRRM